LNVSKTGLGIFKPAISQSIYFFTDNTSEQVLDSITFKKNEFGSYEISTAPPWLVPEHMKLDYDILMFKLISLDKNYVKLEVNKETAMQSYVKKDAGQVMFWPEFLLSVHSVELKDKDQKLHVKPQDNAASLKVDYEILQPVKVEREWLNVKLLDDVFQEKGQAWIKWRDNSGLLINYHLLS